MGYRIDFGPWGSIFAVPTALVDRHLRFCSESQLKVLLLALREGQAEPDPAVLAGRLSLSEETVLDALAYWAESGLFQAAAEPPAAEPPAPAPAGTPSEEKVTVQKTPAGNTVRTITARRRLSPGEINELLSRDSRFPGLIGELESRYGKVFSPTEREAVAYLYRYLELPADYLLMAAAYCREKGKTSLHYLEKTVSGWVEDGIDTSAKAEQHLTRLKERDSDEARLRRLFGLPQRKFTARETECAARWCREYRLSDELLRLAYDRTVDNTGKVSFPYMDKIIEAWHQKGVTSPEEAMAADGARAAGRRGDDAYSFDIDTAIRIMNENSAGKEEEPWQKK